MCGWQDEDNKDSERAQITGIHAECEDVCQEVGLTFYQKKQAT